MRFVFFSDTHTYHEHITLPEGDVLAFTGDMCGRGTFPEVVRFLEWIKRLPYKHIVFIAGNHDWPFDDTGAPHYTGEKRGALASLPAHVHYLENSGVEVEGVSFWGMPQTPRFFNWAFNVDRHEPMRAYTDLIPDKVDIVLSHGPKHMVMDKTMEGLHVGCEELGARLAQVDHKVHAFGHIHEGYGHRYMDGVHHVNASVVTRFYDPINRPIALDYDAATGAFTLV